MTENLKKFLEAASVNEEYAEKIKHADSEEAVIALAKEMGFTLTAEDLKKEEAIREISDDELAAVTGGENCYCIVGGGGTGHGDSKTCACIYLGMGYNADGEERCGCVGDGMGYPC